MKGWVAGMIGLGAAAGCHHADPKSVDVPLVEEFKAPPQEDRYNQAPTQQYKKPDPKKEFKPGMGGPGSGPPGMGM